MPRSLLVGIQHRSKVITRVRNVNFMSIAAGPSTSYKYRRVNIVTLSREEGSRRAKMQKELEAEGFEPPAFRKHLEQCKANVIPLHQAPVSLLFERPNSV